jgi:hypothetical protein
MTTPIELINERLEEISKTLKLAHKNRLDKTEIDKIIDIYNHYFYAVQLLQQHSQIPQYFSKLIQTTENHIYYRKTHLNRHIECTKFDY